jgi:hypothetical protein
VDITCVKTVHAGMVVTGFPVIQNYLPSYLLSKTVNDVLNVCCFA